MLIDESWTTTTMARRHGRAGRGERLVADCRMAYWKTTAFVAAPRLRRRSLQRPTRRTPWSATYWSTVLCFLPA